jgi:hypothetical protein
MNPSETSIATISLARAADEERVLRAGLSRLASVGVPVTVADGGSTPGFVQFITELPGVRLAGPSERGLVGQIKASLSGASALETPFILYTEPDKVSFFERWVASFIERAPNGGEVGVVLASRSDASFGTYPPLQRFTETTINRLCGDVTGVPGDYSYGPFLVNRALLPYIHRLPTDIGWGWRHFVFGLAHRLGYKVLTIVDDHPCPPDQRAEDAGERIHRMRQLSQNVSGLVRSMTIDP